MSGTNTYDSTTAETETYTQKSKEDGTYQFRYDGDRRYHGFKDSIYYLPNDEREHVRLDQLHAFMKKFWGSNIFAPIVSEPSLIMDVGAGRGGWVIDVAKQYPRAKVIGFDLSPIIRHEKPENAEFVVGDLHVDLERFINGTFDLIHSRMLCGGVKADEWDRYIKKVFELLKPGTGWAQFVEDSYKTWDGDAVPEASPFYKFIRFSRRYLERNGFQLNGDHVIKRFEDAGFADIQVFRRKVHIGDWGEPESEMTPFWNERKSIYSKIIEPVVMTNMKDEFPDDKERSAFAKAALKDFLEHPYHVYAMTYHFLDTPVDGVGTWSLGEGLLYETRTTTLYC